MFRFKTELKILMEQVREYMRVSYGHERVLEILSEDNERLKEEIRRLTRVNERLLDRVMARDFETFGSYSEPLEESSGVPFHEDRSPFQMEENIGEEIEDAEQNVG
jgi:hypothetical protein